MMIMADSNYEYSKAYQSSLIVERKATLSSILKMTLNPSKYFPPDHHVQLMIWLTIFAHNVEEVKGRGRGTNLIPFNRYRHHNHRYFHQRKREMELDSPSFTL